MIRNYFISALRNFWRNRLITLINLLGMSIGFGIFLSLWSWVRYDLSFDRFHNNIEQLYYLNVRFSMNGSEYTSERTAGIYARLLPDNSPQVKEGCRVSQPLDFELGIATDYANTDQAMQYFSEDMVLAVDSNFFSLFSFPLIQGDLASIFSERDHLVITKSLAQKIFGDNDPMGRSVRFGEGGFLTVAGVVEDPPVQSSIRFEALIGFHHMARLGYPLDGYGGTMFYNFFLLQPDADLAGLNRSINELISQNHNSDLDEYYFIDNFSRMYLHGETRSIIGVYLNIIMSLLILGIACINFINLTTATSMTRHKEIIIRKKMGAGKRQLIFQFMAETYLLLAVSFYLGFFIKEHLTPVLERNFGSVQIVSASSPIDWVIYLSIYLITGFAAGLYPATRIANVRPMTVLPVMQRAQSGAKNRIRKILVVAQFSFSLVIILVSIFTNRQFKFLKEADLGFKRENIIYISTTGKAWDAYDLIKQELEDIHFVEAVTSGSEVPIKVDRGDLDWGEREGEHNQIARILFTDEDFLRTFEIDLEKGSYFSEGMDSLNHQYVIVNRALVELMGWEDPIGHSFYMWEDDYIVKGVCEDIKFFPFNLGVFDNEALIFRFTEVADYIFLSLNQGLDEQGMSRIEDVFERHNPGYPLEYNYVSDFRYEAQENESALRLLFRMFSGLAIFIAIMGLLGLSVYNNNRRIKEVGIRKAMGARTAEILHLLLRELSTLLVISNLIAIPAAYLLMRRILSIFSYRIDLDIWVFIMVLALSFILSFLIVSYHTVYIARSNPSDSLRYE